jgi:hypothetical protein
MVWSKTAHVVTYLMCNRDMSGLEHRNRYQLCWLHIHRSLPEIFQGNAKILPCERQRLPPPPFHSTVHSLPLVSFDMFEIASFSSISHLLCNSSPGSKNISLLGHYTAVDRLPTSCGAEWHMPGPSMSLYWRYRGRISAVLRIIVIQACVLSQDECQNTT